MPLFISHSHADKAFVDRLAANLAARKTYVWIDRWELNVGDSLISRIQEAITDASAMLFILSKASVASEWCKKELSAGLIRELEEKRVVVLPVLVEDCDIPLFLRDKLYADFRKNFDDGLKAIIAAVAKVTSSTLGRTSTVEYIHDWSINWGTVNSHTMLRVTVASLSPTDKHTVVAIIDAEANDAATRQYQHFVEAGLGWFCQMELFDMCSHHAEGHDFQVLIENSSPVVRQFEVGDSTSGVAYQFTLSVRRIGEDNGKHILCDYGFYFKMISETLNKRLRKLTPEEERTLAYLLTHDS
jgi:hypothetical protein